jgi:hypothetical protein
MAKGEEMKKISRKFYRQGGFIGGVAYVLYQGRGKIFGVLMNGKKENLSKLWTLKEMLALVKSGVWTESKR